MKRLIGTTFFILLISAGISSETSCRGSLDLMYVIGNSALSQSTKKMTDQIIGHFDGAKIGVCTDNICELSLTSDRNLIMKSLLELKRTNNEKHPFDGLLAAIKTQEWRNHYIAGLPHQRVVIIIAENPLCGDESLDCQLSSHDIKIAVEEADVVPLFFIKRNLNNEFYMKLISELKRGKVVFYDKATEIPALIEKELLNSKPCSRRLTETRKICPAKLDLIFAIDETKSMRGIIDAVKKESQYLMEKLSEDYPGSRFGLTVFSDKDDYSCFGEKPPVSDRPGDCINKDLDVNLTTDIQELRKKLHAIDASAVDKTYPEDSILALLHSMSKQPWRHTVSSSNPYLRFIVLFSDNGIKWPGEEKCQDRKFIPYHGDGSDYKCMEHQNPNPPDAFRQLTEQNITPIFIVKEQIPGAGQQYEDAIQEYNNGRGLVKVFEKIENIISIIEDTIAESACKEYSTPAPSAPPNNAITEEIPNEQPSTTPTPSSGDDGMIPIVAAAGAASLLLLGAGGYAGYTAMGGNSTSSLLQGLDDAGFDQEVVEMHEVLDKDQLAQVQDDNFTY